MRLSCTLLCVIFLASCASSDIGRVDDIVVFKSGSEGYHTFRIPALITTPSGTLLAFCEGRKTDGRDHGDIDLVLKRSSDNGATWGPLEVVYEEGGTEKITIGNPCPVIDEETGTIWLPFCRDNDDVLVMFSTDEGRTWSPPLEITQDVKDPAWAWYATGPGVGIQLRQGPHAGRLVIPCDHRGTDNEGFERPPMYSHVFYSDDRGQTWKLGGSIAPHTDECQVVELEDGRLLMNMRNYWGRDGGCEEHGKKRAVSYSDDGGLTWGAPSFDGTLIEPICQGSLVRYRHDAADERSRLLFSNPAATTARVRGTVRLSYDDGRTWPVAKQLHAGPSAYSCLTVLKDGTIGCVFEAGEERAYEAILFSRFSMQWLEK